MQELYDKYQESFQRVNSPTREAFELAAHFYSAQYQQFLPADKNARILDVGCGMGHFLYFLKKEGYTNYRGIDISPTQVQFARDNVTERASLADAFDYLNTNDTFDVIVANDIIEHIPRDKTLHFLGLIYDSLEPNGLLLAKTLNMSNPFGLQTRYLDFTHEEGFTEYSLRQVLSISGFHDIQIMGTHLESRTLKSWIVRLRERIAHEILKQMLRAQGYRYASILDSNLIAICAKKTK
jgi:cyclopropane fatty-acyl-phospholipid synthase-like methyltransferase